MNKEVKEHVLSGIDPVDVSVWVREEKQASPQHNSS